jgi:hypothetical protein
MSIYHVILGKLEHGVTGKICTCAVDEFNIFLLIPANFY